MGKHGTNVKYQNYQKVDQSKSKNNYSKNTKREGSSGSRSQSKKLYKIVGKPIYPDQIRNEIYQRNLLYEADSKSKHTKSNSEAAHKSLKYLNDSHSENTANVYANRNMVHRHGKNSEMILPLHNDSGDKNTLLFNHEFNTVKYSQSPFLNKLTNLKQRMSNKKSEKISLGKGHKSRNSMFPKSYTEVNEYPRREHEIYGQFNSNNFDNIPEEDTLKRVEDIKHSNPYMNIDVEHEVSHFIKS